MQIVNLKPEYADNPYYYSWTFYIPVRLHKLKADKSIFYQIRHYLNRYFE